MADTEFESSEYLGIEMKGEVWNADVMVKQEINARELVEVGIQPPTRPVFQNVNARKSGRQRVHHNGIDEEGRAKQLERNKLQKRSYRAGKPEEALARERERNKLYMRKVRATFALEQEQDERTDLEMCCVSRLEQNSVHVNRVTSKRKPVSALTREQLERQRERNRNYMRKVRAALYEEEHKLNPLWKPRLGKRKSVIALTPEQLERQRERNRNYMRRFRASLSEDELRRQRERDRILKRKAREMLKEQTLKLKHFFSYEQQWNVMRELYLNQLQHYRFQNGHLEYLCIQDGRENEEVQSTNIRYVKQENTVNITSRDNVNFT